MPEKFHRIDVLTPLINSLRRDVSALKIYDKTDGKWTTACLKHQPCTTERLAFHTRTADANCPEAVKFRGAMGLYFVGANDADLLSKGSTTTQAALLDLDDHGNEYGLRYVLDVARRLAKIAKKYNLRASPWVSSGGGGVHLWFRWETPQDAYSVRMALSKILDRAGYKNGAGSLQNREIEVFPKQNNVSPSQVGNMAILPGALLSQHIVFKRGKTVRTNTLEELTSRINEHNANCEEGKEILPEHLFPLSDPVEVLESPVHMSSADREDYLRERRLKREAADLLGYNTYEGLPERDLEDMRRVLDALPSETWDNHDSWVRAGIALVNEHPEAGLDLFHEYSAKSGKYDPEVLDYRADSLLRASEERLRRGEPVLTFASLRMEARAHGYDLPSVSDFEEFEDDSIEVDDDSIESDEASDFDDDTDVASKNASGFVSANPLLPTLERAHGGMLLPHTGNLLKILPMKNVIGGEFAGDNFTGKIMVRGVKKMLEWRQIRDSDETKLKARLENMGKGFLPIPRTELKACLHCVAEDNAIDLAQDWCDALPAWDGVPRIDTFIGDYMWGRQGHDYERAVSRYMFSALAGRLLDPGVKAEIVPIFIGEQGLRKSSALEVLAPWPETFGEIDLEDKEDELARRIVGKSIIELVELKGVGTKDEEALKAFFSQKKEVWRPLYKEHTVDYLRRCLFIGTSNKTRILADLTGNRRWAPVLLGSGAGRGKSGVGEQVIDLEGIEAIKEQLWAEACHLYREHGVLFEECERLARGEHHKYMRVHPWEELLAEWLEEYPETMRMDGEAFVDLSMKDIYNAVGLKGRLMRHDRDMIDMFIDKMGLEEVRVGRGRVRRLRYHFDD